MLNTFGLAISALATEAKPAITDTSNDLLINLCFMGLTFSACWVCLMRSFEVGTTISRAGSF
jgi:hypothetical protein